MVAWFGPYLEANAQSPPVPPPPPIQGSNEEDVREHDKNLNDKSAPVIEILTKDLTEGKNLIRVSITDDSGIASATVKYVDHGFIKSSDLVNEEGSEYKGLIHVLPPSGVLVFSASDSQGNVAEVPKWFDVHPVQRNFLDNFIDWITSMFS